MHKGDATSYCGAELHAPRQSAGPPADLRASLRESHMITGTVRYKLPPHIDYAACREHFIS
jgi:hypothetical protein